jgi:hypothetical protein
MGLFLSLDFNPVYVSATCLGLSAVANILVVEIRTYLDCLGPRAGTTANVMHGELFQLVSARCTVFIDFSCYSFVGIYIRLRRNATDRPEKVNIRRPA